jgi:hypothetical protein
MLSVVFVGVGQLTVELTVLEVTEEIPVAETVAVLEREVLTWQESTAEPIVKTRVKFFVAPAASEACVQVTVLPIREHSLEDCADTNVTDPLLSDGI